MVWVVRIWSIFVYAFFTYGFIDLSIFEGKTNREIEKTHIKSRFPGPGPPGKDSPSNSDRNPSLNDLVEPCSSRDMIFFVFPNFWKKRVNNMRAPRRREFRK